MCICMFVFFVFFPFTSFFFCICVRKNVLYHAMKLSKFNEDIFTYTVDTVWGLMEVVVTTGAIVQSSSQMITTNKPTPSFFTGRMPLLSPNQQCQSTEGKISHSMDLLTPSSPGGLPTLYLTINSSWLPLGGLPCLSSAI